MSTVEERVDKAEDKGRNIFREWSRNRFIDICFSKGRTDFYDATATAKTGEKYLIEIKNRTYPLDKFKTTMIEEDKFKNMTNNNQTILDYRHNQLFDECEYKKMFFNVWDGDAIEIYNLEDVDYELETYYRNKCTVDPSRGKRNTQSIGLVHNNKRTIYKRDDSRQFKKQPEL